MRKFPLNERDDDGIIHEIRKTKYEEFYRYVDITSSSTTKERYGNDDFWGNERCLLNYEVDRTLNSNNWCSDNVSSSSFIISFYQEQSYITNYSMRSRGVNVPYDMPQTWLLEGSNNNITWNFIDEKRNVQYFAESDKVYTFPVEKSNLYRYFRFKQIDVNLNNRFYFCLGKVDLFGTTFVNYHSCLYNNKIIPNRSCLFILVLICY